MAGRGVIYEFATVINADTVHYSRLSHGGRRRTMCGSAFDARSSQLAVALAGTASLGERASR